MDKRGNECFVYYPCINSNKENIFYVLSSYSTPYAFNVPLKGQLLLVEGIIVLISYYRVEKNIKIDITEKNQIVSEMCVLFQGYNFLRFTNLCFIHMILLCLGTYWKIIWRVLDTYTSLDEYVWSILAVVFVVKMHFLNN